jgi:plasmid maintenance system killer protein
MRHLNQKGLQKFFQTGSTAGIQPKGELKGRWSVSVNGNWRMTFEFENANAFTAV